MNTTNNKRLLVLDAVRGTTIVGVIPVSNPGSWGHAYAPLKHARWSGPTPTDLVSPFLMLIMGISIYISFKEYNFTFSIPATLKVIKRITVVPLIGVALNWFALLCYAHNPLPSEQTRILGVMQRLTLCHNVSALTALLSKHKYVPYLIVVLLVGYFITLITGNGFAYNETNVLSIVDRNTLEDAHTYQDNYIDPEGLLSTIPSIAHVSIGLYVGKLLMEVKGIHEKLERLFLIGTILTFAGFLFSYGCPFNRRIWLPTLMLVTCGLGSSLLALPVRIIDIEGCKKRSRFPESFGTNPLFIYVVAGVIAVLVDAIIITYQEESAPI